MTDIYLHGKQIESIFELLGNKENDITYSIGWTLSNSTAFLKEFIKKILPSIFQKSQLANIYLQEFEPNSGITDIEIKGEEFYCIVEAKRGWYLPGEEQLRRYANRLNENPTKKPVLVVMAECSHEYAKLHIPSHIARVPIKYLNWKDIVIMSRNVSNANHAEKRLLEELRNYLRRIVNMQNQESNMVYVVSLGKDTIKKSSLTWTEVVTKKNRYFHPADKNWPKSPPNYIGFRYYGQLQSIHHIEAWEIVEDLHAKIKEIGIKSGEWGPLFLYNLGKPIIPVKKVKTGNIYPNGRIWAMIDLLLTCDTISDARDLTKKRLSEEN